MSDKRCLEEREISEGSLTSLESSSVSSLSGTELVTPKLIFQARTDGSDQDDTLLIPDRPRKRVIRYVSKDSGSDTSVPKRPRRRYQRRNSKVGNTLCFEGVLEESPLTTSVMRDTTRHISSWKEEDYPTKDQIQSTETHSHQASAKKTTI